MSLRYCSSGQSVRPPPPPLKSDLRSLDAFHNQCLRTILGVSWERQKLERITSAQLWDVWGDTVSVSDRVPSRQLEWLGHIARMPESRLPKRILFARLPHPHPACGPRLRWKDLMARYLETCGCREWYRAAEDRRRWREEVVQSSPPVAPVVCSVVCAGCQRLFRRESDRKRHKCSDVRALPIHQQPGAVQCGICNRWFAAAGGLARHRCDAPAHSASELELSRPPPPPPPSWFLSVLFLSLCLLWPLLLLLAWLPAS